MAEQHSPYKQWVEARRKAESQRLSLFALLEPFVECAIWPHLYPTKQLCESHIGASEDWAPFRAKGPSTNKSKDSQKAHYMAKVCGPIADYAARYDLLQFQFDRHVLRTVLGSDVAEATTSAANRHRHWTPEYWTTPISMI